MKISCDFFGAALQRQESPRHSSLRSRLRGPDAALLERLGGNIRDNARKRSVGAPSHVQIVCVGALVLPRRSRCQRRFTDTSVTVDEHVTSRSVEGLIDLIEFLDSTVKMLNRLDRLRRRYQLIQAFGEDVSICERAEHGDTEESLSGDDFSAFPWRGASSRRHAPEEAGCPRALA